MQSVNCSTCIWLSNIIGNYLIKDKPVDGLIEMERKHNHQYHYRPLELKVSRYVKGN